MIVIEIPPNPNCEAVEMRVFHDLEPPRPVRQLRLAKEGGQPQWCDVVGWSLKGHTAPAVAQRVDDSGEGVALLIHGADAGLRVRPSGRQAPWTLNDPQQWGLPFFLTTDLDDIRFLEENR